MIRLCISPVDGATKQKHVVSINTWKKFSIHLCLHLKYTVIRLRKENVQLKYKIAVLLVASILQHII
jgi:hypothetical protein